jgi:putative permease
MLLPLCEFPGKKAEISRVAWPRWYRYCLLVLSLAGLLVPGRFADLSLADDWPQVQAAGAVFGHSLQQWISVKFHIRIKQQMTYVNNATSKLLETGGSVIGDVLVSLSSLLLTWCLF